MRRDVPLGAAKALRMAIRGKEDAELTIEEEVGFLLLADFIATIGSFQQAYLRMK